MTRLVLPGVPHHVAQQGCAGRSVFFSDADRRAYTVLVAEACRAQKTSCLAWCLIDDHIEFVLVPSGADGLRATLGEAHRLYTRQINQREGRRGALFRGRFSSYPMQSRHLLPIVRHVERLPVIARKVSQAVHWRWSSARAHVNGADDGLTAIDASGEDSHDWREPFVDTLEPADREMIRCHLSTGRPYGEPEWVADLERRTGRTLRPRRRGPKPRPASTA